MGVDIGGTFTDLVIFDEHSKDSPEVVKIPSDPKHPEMPVVKALAAYREKTKQVGLVSHATTIATNALLTRSGLAKTALITNKGFKDVLEIGRQRRPELYNLKTRRPIPLVDGRHRFVLSDRNRADNTHAGQFSQREVRTITREVIKERIESIAIVFINSYLHPEPERKARKLVRESGFKGHIDISSEIDPQYREYERASTTVVNASLIPLMSQYLTGFRKELERIGLQCPISIMNSDGTASTISQASNRPVIAIESGPAAGVLSSKILADHLSIDKVITFDMGGTTAKAGTVIDGRPDLAYEFEAAGRIYHGRSVKGSGYPVRQPFIDMAEVSAGGGTIAWVDETGSLKVGPQSAGAEPGPAAYGGGGTKPTVTDANIIAGRISPTHLLKGKLKLHNHLAVRAVGQLSHRLGTSVETTAENVLRIVNSNMSKALSLISVERGRDPREYTLIAFGGAGPLHACDLAQELGIKRIIIPVHPGLFSAFGLLTVELSRTFSRSILRPVTARIERYFRELRDNARRSLIKEGFTDYKTIEQIDLRYQGQAYEITIPYRKNTDLSRFFGKEHKKLYGYSSNDEVEAVNARIRAIIPTPKAKLVRKKFQTSKPPEASSWRRVSMLGSWQRLPIYNRQTMMPGAQGKGPCIVDEYDSTAMIGKDWTWKIDEYGNIDLRYGR